jgi:hypothetical protein
LRLYFGGVQLFGSLIDRFFVNFDFLIGCAGEVEISASFGRALSGDLCEKLKSIVLFLDDREFRDVGPARFA